MNEIKIMYDWFATPFWNVDTGANMNYNEVSKHFNVDYDLIASFSRKATIFDMQDDISVNITSLEDKLFKLTKEFKRLNPTKTVYFGREEVHLED